MNHLFLASENASDGRFPPGIRSSMGSTTPQIMKKSLLETSVSLTPVSDGSPASTARKRNPLGVSGKKMGPGMFQKLDRKKPSEVKVEIVTPTSCYGMAISNYKDEQGLATSKRNAQSFEKSGIKRALFNENNGKQKLGLFKGGSRVVPCGDTSVVVSNETADICRSQRESEDLSLIRKQLVQIENQQSNLLDLLQVLFCFLFLYICNLLAHRDLSIYKFIPFELYCMVLLIPRLSSHLVEENLVRHIRSDIFFLI